MTQVMNFKRMEVSGFTKEEALEKAPFNVNLPGADCTQALRNFKKTFTDRSFTDADLKQFMITQLQKKTRNTPGNGCYIVVNPAVVDTRERPYKIENIKSEGARKRVTIHQLIDPSTNTIIATTKAKLVDEVDKDGNVVLDEQGNPTKVWKAPTKADAVDLAKSLYTDEGYKGSIICKTVKEVVEGGDVMFKAYYAPSKNTQIGTYLVFGIEAN